MVCPTCSIVTRKTIHGLKKHMEICQKVGTCSVSSVLTLIAGLLATSSLHKHLCQSPGSLSSNYTDLKAEDIIGQHLAGNCQLLFFL